MPELNPKQKPTLDILDLDRTNNQEHLLFESIIAEKCDIAGFKCEFYRRLSGETEDYLYGEDALESFDGPYTTKILYEPTDEAPLIDIFGLSGADTIQSAEIPKVIFERDINDVFYNNTQPISAADIKPNPGDVIKTLWNNKLYEITNVSSEEKIFQGMKLIWSLTMKPFRTGQSDTTEDSMMFTLPLSADFPDENITTITRELSAYGENDLIENDEDVESYADLNSSFEDFYGYGPKE
jgi:hypothetical protein